MTASDIYDASLRRGSGNSSWLFYAKQFNENQQRLWRDASSSPPPIPINSPTTFMARYREVMQSHKHQGVLVAEPASYTSTTHSDPNVSRHPLALPTHKKDFALFRQASMDYIWKSSVVGYIWKAGRSLLQHAMGGILEPLPEDESTPKILATTPSNSEKDAARLQARKKRQKEYEHAYAIIVQASTAYFYSSGIRPKSDTLSGIGLVLERQHQVQYDCYSLRQFRAPLLSPSQNTDLVHIRYSACTFPRGSIILQDTNGLLHCGC